MELWLMGLLGNKKKRKNSIPTKKDINEIEIALTCGIIYCLILIVFILIVLGL